MSVLTDIAAGLWIFFTGAAAARIAFERRKKQVINMHIKVRDTGFDRWLEQVKAEAWDEGYGCGRDDEEAETRTNQMHATLNPYRKAQTDD